MTVFISHSKMRFFLSGIAMSLARIFAPNSSRPGFGSVHFACKTPLKNQIWRSGLPVNVTSFWHQASKGFGLQKKMAKQSLLSHYLSLTNHFINASRYYETICVVFTDDKNFWVIFNMTFNFIWTLEIFAKIEFLTRLITLMQLMHIYI